MSITPGTKLEPYEIQSTLGAGGMGEVYKARDTRLGRTVAINVLTTHVAADPDLRHRFERKAKAILRLDHPHMCILDEVGHKHLRPAEGARGQCGAAAPLDLWSRRLEAITKRVREPKSKMIACRGARSNTGRVLRTTA